ncbi:hypothetical protein KSF_100300 [Reticulibacter mediterranei]|uniref:NAD-dependent epimerase/dehydratase domain-containing protein n=1 Tax=Reticulibacter mediterranei TaxID=2778369 RepID=A0A8J3N653_9CHLR|nr:NAD-dependent epimerase/dehydratase family protein [Reticulibacter mediterranei]GHO99982.1 hypothetical protein KSF_100300 [Reticulibacter mediterranei]
MNTTSTSSRRVHTVLGSTGGIGGALVHELVQRGHSVRAVSRSGRSNNVSDHIEVVAADISNPDVIRAVTAGSAVIYYATQPDYTRWPEELPGMIDALLAGLIDTPTKLVVADNVYMYGPYEGSYTETLPYAATDRKGRVRAQAATRLLNASAQGQLRITLGRLSDYYGPGGLSKISPAVFTAALSGQPAPWFGRLDQPHTLAYLPDVARALITLGERDEADGQAWHLPAAEALTGQQFLELVYTEAKTPYNVQLFDRETVETLASQVPVMREFAEIFYQNEAPFVIDASHYQNTFGPFQPTPHRKAIRDTLAYYRENSLPERTL